MQGICIIRNIKSWVFFQFIFVCFWVSNLIKTDSFLTVYLFCALAGAFSICYNVCTLKPVSARIKYVVSFFACCFSAATVLANYPLFAPITAMLSLFNTACSLLGGFFVGYNVLLCLVNRLPLVSEQKKSALFASKPGWVFFLSFFFIFSVFFLYLITTAYPVYLAHDSIVSLEQIKSGLYTNDHPYWYTKFISLCLEIGYLFSDDINVACATYSTIQSFLMALCFAYSVVTLVQAGMPWWCSCVCLFLYAFLPYNLTYSVTMWKDTLFGGFSVAVVCSLYRILNRIGKVRFLNYVVFLISGIGFCLVRHNGFPLFLAWFTLIFLLLGKKHKKLVFVMLLVLAVSWTLSNPVLELLGVGETQLTEVLAVPFQQIARVISLDLPVSDADREFLSSIFWLDRVKELYSPEIVDPIKFEAMRPEGRAFLEENMKEFVALWIRMGLQHPGEYIKAWVEQTKGYWNGGYYFWIYIRTTWYETTGIGGFTMDNIGKSLFDAIFRYLEKPVIMEPLYSIGFQIWIIIACSVVCFLQRRSEGLLMVPFVVLAVGLWLITPVYAEFRYAYPFFVTCPLILFVTLFHRSTEEDGRDQKIGRNIP